MGAFWGRQAARSDDVAMAMTLATNRTARFKKAALEKATLERANLERANLAHLRACPLPCQEASASERKLGCSIKSVCWRWFMPILRAVDAASLNLDVELVTRNLCETFGPSPCVESRVQAAT